MQPFFYGLVAFKDCLVSDELFSVPFVFAIVLVGIEWL